MIPTPYDDTLLTAKVDFQPSTNQTLFARFAYQDQSSPNDQIPVPATADLNNGNTNTTRNYDFVGSHTLTHAVRTGSTSASFHYQNFGNAILPNVTGVPFLDFPSVDTRAERQHAAGRRRSRSSRCATTSRSSPARMR